MSVTITVDGKKIEAREGALLIDVCRENGIDIPHFCYHPGLGPDGNCRMCQVEFVSDRGNRLGISCNAVVAEGMEVLTQSEAVKRARASVEEMLLLNHPLDCPICDKAGECTLQDYYYAHDLQDSRTEFERYRKKKAVDIGPTMILDQQRCVLCDRCVRFLRDIAGDHQLHIAGRAHSAYITTFPGEEVTSPYSLNTVDLCPVGALTAKDFRFASPTWFLKKTPSVCITCARGCNTEINSKKDKIYRIRARHNQDVNGHWMCDDGRLNYRFVNDNRLTRPALGPALGPALRSEKEVREISYEEALEKMRSLLGREHSGTHYEPAGAQAAVLVSATCTLEEIFQAKRLARTFLNAPVFAVQHVPDGVEDSLLRKADRHPNTKGAELLGVTVLDLTGAAAEAVVKPLEDALSPEGTLVCVGFDYEISDGLKRLVTQARHVVTLSACETFISEKATLVVPGLTFAEKDGLLVNFQGHVQRLGVALDHSAWFAPTAQKVRNAPAPQSQWKILEDFMVLIGGEGTASINQLRKTIKEKEPAFSGIDLTDVGSAGISLKGQPVG